VQYFILLYIHICKPSFQLHQANLHKSHHHHHLCHILHVMTHDVVALIVIQPFAIGQPLHVKFTCLSIFLILLRFLPFVVTFCRKYFIFGKFSNNCQIKIFDHCSHRKFSLSLPKIPFLFLKYWYGDFSNCRKGILNPYLYYALNNESRMAKYQAIICHRSLVEIKMLGLRYVAGAIPGKSLWLISKKSSPLKPVCQVNRNLVGCIYGLSSIKFAHFVLIY
jgi:hypothetical protein